MKKNILAVLLCLCTALSFGCGQTKSNNTDITAQSSTQNSGETAIDYDLTKMSSTMVYSTVYSMITNPDEYRGKLVKVTGNFNVYTDAVTNMTYYSVLIADATACCQQGLEIDMKKFTSDEYPPQNALITVTGTFGTYMEGEYMYSILNDATIHRE